MNTVKLSTLKQGDRFKLKKSTWEVIGLDPHWKDEYIRGEQIIQCIGINHKQNRHRSFIGNKDVILVSKPLPFLTQLFNKIFG